MEDLGKRLPLENQFLDLLKIPFPMKDLIFKKRLPLHEFVELCQSEPGILDVCPNEYGLPILCKKVLHLNGLLNIPDEENICQLMNRVVLLKKKLEEYNGSGENDLVSLLTSYKFSLIAPSTKELTPILLENSKLNKNEEENALQLLNFSNLIIEEVVREANGDVIEEGTSTLVELRQFLQTHYVSPEIKDAFIEQLLDDTNNAYRNIMERMPQLSEVDIERNKNALIKQEELIAALIFSGGAVKSVIRKAVQFQMINLLYKIVFDRKLKGYALRESLKMRRDEITDMLFTQFVPFDKIVIRSDMSIFDQINKWIELGSYDIFTESETNIYRYLLQHGQRSVKEHLVQDANIHIELSGLDKPTRNEIVELAIKHKNKAILGQINDLDGGLLINFVKMNEIDLLLSEIDDWVTHYFLKIYFSEKFLNVTFIKKLFKRCFRERPKYFFILGALITGMNRRSDYFVEFKFLFEEDIETIAEELVYNSADKLLEFLLKDPLRAELVNMRRLLEIAFDNDLQSIRKLLLKS